MQSLRPRAVCFDFNRSDAVPAQPEQGAVEQGQDTAGPFFAVCFDFNRTQIRPLLELF